MKEILTRVLSLLIVLTLSTTSLYAQVPIKKPEKKTTTATTTTTTQQKPITSTSTISQSSSSTKSTKPQPTTGSINGYEWVDLGLSVKWATCNVGASSPSDYGNYYAWGETSTKSEYTEENSKTYGKSIGSIAGNPQYDAARANWGSTWRLPTASEIDELINKCTWAWSTQGDHNGCKITGPNGKSIFLPAAGWRFGTSLVFAGEGGYYWDATPYEDNADEAYELYFGSDGFGKGWINRGGGQPVRPVSE